MIVLPLGKRFWSKVDKRGEDECWEWIASTNNYGYGQISYPRADDGASVPRMAHRCSFLEHYGYLPKLVDHECINRLCVNPRHLREATQKQNAENHPATRSNNTSGYIGVSWDKRLQKWRAYTKHNYKYIHVGMFDTAEAANEAVIAKRVELFTHNSLDRK